MQCLLPLFIHKVAFYTHLAKHALFHLTVSGREYNPQQKNLVERHSQALTAQSEQNWHGRDSGHCGNPGESPAPVQLEEQREANQGGLPGRSFTV